MAFSAYIYGKMQRRYFVWVLSRGEAFAHFFKPHSEFFCESQLTNHWAIAAVQKKKTMTKYLGGKGEWAAWID